MHKLEPFLAEMLTDLAVVLQQYQVDFYLVGAAARDIWLSANEELAALRKTNDVDLAIMLSNAEQFNDLKAALIQTGNFEAHPTEAIKIFYKNAIEADLLPFGEIESATRMTHLKNPTFVLHMPGFREAYPFADEVRITEQLTVKVCSIEGIVLLKLISHQDRPQRTKDLLDIEHIIAVYFEINQLEIYEHNADLLEAYDTKDLDYLKLISSRMIGRKFRALLKDSDLLKDRIARLLDKRRDDIYKAMLDGLNDE